MATKVTTTRVYGSIVGNNGNYIGVAFTTPSTGATSLTIKCGWTFNSGDWSEQGTWKNNFVVRINRSWTNYNEKGVDAAGVFDYDQNPGHQTLNTTVSINLIPGQEYVAWFFSWGNGNPTFTLDTIDNNHSYFQVDGSFGTPSTITANNGYIGNSIPITLNRSIPNVTHTVSVSCAGISTQLLNNSTATSASWTPDVSTYLSKISTLSATATITCVTKYGSNTLGTTTKNITVTFKTADIGITVDSGWAAISAYNTGKVDGLTGYIQGYSKVKADFTTSKVHLKGAATVSSWKLEYASKTYTGNPAYSDVITATGTGSAKLTVTDSRGMTASTTLTFEITPYSNPVLSNVSVFRCTADGSANPSGTYCYAYADAIVASVAGQNTVTMQSYYRNASGSTWTSWRTMSSGTADISTNWPADVTYEFRILLTDRLGNTTEVVRTLPAQSWAMKFRTSGNNVVGVGFGKAAESDNVLEIPDSWNIRKGLDNAVFRGELLNLIYPVGSIYMSINSTSPATLFGGTWERITGRFLLAATDGGASGGNSNASIKPGYTGGEATHKLTVSEMPSHSHSFTAGDPIGWPQNASANEHINSNWGSSAWPKVAETKLNNTGGNGYHNNMPPYLAVYMWKRTA